MRINWHERITTCDIILTPYRRALVPAYHDWMSDAWLRAATSSEEMTLAEEYEAQRGWRDDESKLTFIFFERVSDKMIGDVNLFLLDAAVADADYWGGGGSGSAPTCAIPAAAEVMVMVGDPSARRRGYAACAVRAIAHYAALRLGVRRLVAKIGADNAASRRLFASLGFRLAKEVAVFSEVHYVAEVDDPRLACGSDLTISRDEAVEEEE